MIYREEVNGNFMKVKGYFELKVKREKIYHFSRQQLQRAPDSPRYVFKPVKWNCTIYNQNNKMVKSK